MLEVAAILGFFFVVNVALGLLGVVGALPVVLVMRLRHGAELPRVHPGAQFVAAVATGITVGWAVGVAYTLLTIYLPWNLEIIGMYPVFAAALVAGAVAAVIVGTRARRRHI